MEATQIMYSVRKALSLSIASLTIALSLAACDGGGSNLAGDNRKVSSLSEAQQKEVCEDARDSISDADQKALARVLCTSLLVEFGGECSPAAVDECVKQVGSGDPEPTPDDECDLGVDVKACDVTVAQLFDCQQDSLAILVDNADKVTCENVDTGGGIPQEQPASCNIVQEKCPSFFDGSEDPQDGAGE
jgi:hypothetical protein